MKCREVFALALAAALLLAGCQPTPEREAVVPQGNASRIEDILQETPAPEKYTAPARWTEEDTSMADKLVIRADAPVECPDVDAFPVVDVAPEQFSQETVDRLTGYFAGERKLFAWPAPETKEDLRQALIEYKRGMEVDGEYVPPEPDDPYIAELEERIANAPEDNARIYIDTALQPGEYGRRELSAGVEWSPEEDATLSVTNHGDGEYDSSYHFHRGTNPIMMEEGEIPPASLTEAEAVAAAETCLAELGIEGMAFSSASQMAFTPQSTLAGARLNFTSSGYEICFTRAYGGLQLIDTSAHGTYTGGSERSTAEYLPQYNAPWHPETIYLYVDAAGVQRMSWMGYSSVTGVAAENAPLLPFSEITSRAKQQLYYQNGANVPTAEQTEIEVYRVALGLALVNRQNAPGQGQLMPAWYFFFHFRQDGSGQWDAEEGSSLVLNALDGSVIRPIPAMRPE